MPPVKRAMSPMASNPAAASTVFSAGPSGGRGHGVRHGAVLAFIMGNAFALACLLVLHMNGWVHLGPCPNPLALPCDCTHVAAAADSAEAGAGVASSILTDRSQARLRSRPYAQSRGLGEGRGEDSEAEAEEEETGVAWGGRASQGTKGFGRSRTAGEEQEEAFAGDATQGGDQDDELQSRFRSMSLSYAARRRQRPRGTGRVALEGGDGEGEGEGGSRLSMSVGRGRKGRNAGDEEPEGDEEDEDAALSNAGGTATTGGSAGSGVSVESKAEGSPKDPEAPECDCPATPYSNIALPTFPEEWTHATQEVSTWIWKQNLKRRERAAGRNVARFIDGWYERTESRPALKNAVFVLETLGPTYPCFPEERFGTWLDGGKWVCRPSLINSTSVVYSIGSRGSDSYERDLYGRTRAEIHVFDHTLEPTLQLSLSTRKAYRFHPVGLGSTTDHAAKLMSFQDIKKSIGHTQVDILKIDCEGCEYDVLPSLLEAEPIPFGQLQVEAHFLNRKNYRKLSSLILLLERKGYRMFHLEMNWRVMNSVELAFVHESLC